MIAFIDDHRDVHEVESTCRLLQIAPSTYDAQVAHPSGETRQFGNDQRGNGKLLCWLRKRAVVFEAAGSYARELERRLEKSALPFARVNPSKARRPSIRSPEETRSADRGGSC